MVQYVRHLIPILATTALLACATPHSYRRNNEWQYTLRSALDILCTNSEFDVITDAGQNGSPDSVFFMVPEAAADILENHSNAELLPVLKKLRAESYRFGGYITNDNYSVRAARRVIDLWAVVAERKLHGERNICSVRFGSDMVEFPFFLYTCPQEALRSSSPPPFMSTRSYPIRRSEVVAWLRSGGPSFEAGFFGIEAFFVDAGVAIPEGSMIRYDETREKLIVRNTPENQRLIIAAIRSFRTRPNNRIKPRGVVPLAHQ